MLFVREDFEQEQYDALMDRTVVMVVVVVMVMVVAAAVVMVKAMVTHLVMVASGCQGPLQRHQE